MPNFLKRVFYVFLCINFIYADYSLMQAFAQDADIKNVLVLNSYQNGLSWTDHEVEGILSALDESDIKVQTSVEYMDWKNYPTEQNLKTIYESLAYKYSEKHLDVVITTDDAALDFSLKNRDELFPGTPIVFCGVNEIGIRELTKGYINVTGVAEEVDAERTIQAALLMKPDLKEIYVVYDNTESGRSTGKLTIQEIHRLAPAVKAVSINQGGFNNILLQVAQVPEDSVILITTYYKDNDGKVIGFEDSSELISKKSKVPVFHLYEFGMDHGAIGGSMLFGDLQGNWAGKITGRILQGTDVSKIPIYRGKTTRYVFDYNELIRFHIPHDRLPENSQIIHRPFSFIETYRNLVITVLAIFLLLVSFILVLLYYLRKISRMKQKLYDSNLELTNLYDELAVSDEELKQQFDELSIMQRNLLDSDERYAQLFERMLNGFFVFEPITDRDGRLTDFSFVAVNPSFEYHTRKKITRIIGKTWTEVFGVPYNDLEKFQRILDTGTAERFEAYNPDENAYYLINAFRIQNNQVGVVIDNITDYKKAIEEVGKLNEELEQRVTERTFDLQNAITELEAFASTVSHDLKSPLRAVDGYSRIILEDHEKELNEDIVSMLSMIRNVCAEMIDMINKLLQYSTSTRIALHYEPVDCAQLFHSIFNEQKSADANRKIEFRIETGMPTVMADRILLRQAVYNILSNAVKFTKDKEEAKITAGATITEDEYVFYVKDNGVGFDMKYSQKLFNIFQRMHTSDEFEGSGIGLVTVKKIIEKHGGRTWIEGKVNNGATVFFTLPIDRNKEGSKG